MQDDSRMEQRGVHTLAEASDPVPAWRDTLEQIKAGRAELTERFRGRSRLVLTGCGSALNVAFATAPLFQAGTSRAAAVAQAADLFLYPEAYLPEPADTVVIGISRSGRTTETVRALTAARAAGAATIALTTEPGCPLVAAADVAILLTVAQEKSVATTRSVTAMILAMQALAAAVAGDEPMAERLRSVPDHGAALLDRARVLGETVGSIETISRFAFLGGGPYYGLAREAQLKAKEMAILPSDAYPALDFRHGPKACVNEQTLVALLFTDRGAELEAAALAEMRQLGGRTLAVCDRATDAIRAGAEWVFEIGSGLPEWDRAILNLPVLQFTTYFKAIGCGEDPDHPRNLDYCVTL